MREDATEGQDTYLPGSAAAGDCKYETEGDTQNETGTPHRYSRPVTPGLCMVLTLFLRLFVQ